MNKPSEYKKYEHFHNLYHLKQQKHIRENTP